MKLNSGLRILVEEDHSSPVAGVVTVIGSGSSADPPGKEGLAHLVEHLAFRAKHVPDRTMTSLLNQAGAGNSNASTWFDRTTYHAFGPKDALADLLALQTLLLQDPLAGVDEAAFTVERDIVRNELRERNELGQVGQALSELQRAVFPAAHPYARSVGGTHESLDSLTLEDARAYTRAHYRPANATMVLLGDVDLSKVDALLSVTLPPSLVGPQGPAARTAVAAPRLPPSAPAVPATPPAHGWKVIEGHVAAPEIWLAWSLPRNFDIAQYLNLFTASIAEAGIAGAAALDEDILSTEATVMGGVEASMLFCRIVLREGKDPEASAERVLDRVPSGPGTWSGTAVSRDAPPFPPRNVVLTRSFFLAEQMVERASARAEFAHFSGAASVFARGQQVISGLTSENIADYANKWVRRERARAVLVRPIAGRIAPSITRAAREELDRRAPRGTATYDVASIDRVARPAGAAALQSTRLPNGMEILVGSHGSLPIVTLSLSFDAGSATAEPLGVVGLVRSTASWNDPSYGVYSRYGATLDMAVTPDEFRFTVRATSDALKDVLRVLRDHVSSLQISSGAFRAFRIRALPRLKLEDALPERIAERRLLNAIAGSSAFARTSTAADFERLKRDDAENWISERMGPQNATLVVVGGIEPASASRAVADAFASWSGGKRSLVPPPSTELSRERRVLVSSVAGATQATMSLGCTLPAVTPDRAVSSELAGAILASRLGTSLRQELGATYGVHERVAEHRGGTSYLVVRAEIENGKLAQALRRIRATIDADAHGVVSSDGEFDLARWNMAIHYNLALASTGHFAEAILAVRKLGWEPAVIDQLPRRIANATPAFVVETLSACERGMVLSLAGDEPTIRAALAASWP